MNLTRNSAAPIARRLIATPETTWSALNVIEATAWRMDNSAPTTIAARRATHGVMLPNTSTNVRLKTMAVNAPITIKPSKPIFTTPELSEKFPPNPVKISGAAQSKVDGIIINRISIKPTYFTPFC